MQDKVQAEMSQGRDLGITGTPTFFLNGEQMEIETFQGFVEQVAVAVDPEAAANEANSESDESVVGEGSGESVRFGL